MCIIFKRELKIEAQCSKTYSKIVALLEYSVRLDRFLSYNWSQLHKEHLFYKRADTITQEKRAHLRLDLNQSVEPFYLTRNVAIDTTQNANISQ